MTEQSKTTFGDFKKGGAQLGTSLLASTPSQLSHQYSYHTNSPLHCTGKYTPSSKG